MRKQVTFVEEIKKEEHLIQHGSSRFIATRSAGSSHSYRNQYNDSDGVYNVQNSTRIHRASHFKITPNQPGNQQMKTIHIPKSMMTAPFLQHPSLTAGQKRYLYSIANVYSTEHMRRQMKQHYLNVLRSCIRAGHSSTLGTRSSAVNPLLKEKLKFEIDHQRDSSSIARTKLCGHSQTEAVPSGKIILPRIANTQNRTSRTSASNEKRCRKASLYPYVAQHSSSKGIKQSVPEKQDELLSENMSSLSIEEEEDIVFAP